MGVNVIFNDINYQILPKQQEQFDKYCKIIQWGRRHPTRFAEDFMNIQLTDMQKWVILNSWVPSTIVWNMSRGTGKSYMASIFIMLRSLLFPHHHSYIMAPSGSQSTETFMKIESIAKNNIASAVGITRVFIDECKRHTSKADPFTHNAQSHEVSLFNGSSIHSLNSVAKNIVGIRSNFNIYDEAGKIEPEFFALTQPFTVQDADFKTGAGINIGLFPKQLQNKTLYSSSAEGVDSELFKQYKLAFQRMLCGDPDYFVADIDCTFSLHPYMNGKPFPPQLSQKTIDAAMETNPFKARREYYNIFDNDSSDDVFIKRSTINKFTQPYFPIFKNEDKTKKYIMAYDPATKLDNSVVLVAEIFRDENKGLMLKLVNCVNLIEVLKNGEKAVIQKPKQMEILKNMILSYNLGAMDYENIEKLILDSGAGGGGTDIGQYLLNEWIGSDNKTHIGFIDINDPYMAIRADDYIGNSTKLKMFNFKKEKTQAYERAQSAINQGLVIFPQDLNPRNELELLEVNVSGESVLRFEKANSDEINSLVQMSLLKEEITGMQKVKKPSGLIVFEQSTEAKQAGKHDDRVDCLVMICDWLMYLRAEEALKSTESSESGYMEILRKMQSREKQSNNPFGNLGNNPFASQASKRFFT